MSDATDYRISVQRRSTEDGLMFEGTVAEFPDVAVYCDKAVDAYAEVVEVIEKLAAQYVELRRAMPAPIARQDAYSGKWLTRAPKNLHRDLVETADLEGVSFNQYVVTVLSAHRQLRPPFGVSSDVLIHGNDATQNIMVVSSGVDSETSNVGGAVRPKLKLVGGNK